MRKVFLEDLPRWEETSRYKGKIKWKDCIGKIVKFTYDGFEGEMEIVKFEKLKHNVIVKFRENEYKISTGNFVKGRIQKIIPKENLKDERLKYRFAVGDILNQLKFSEIEILERIRYENYTWTVSAYKYKCHTCGNIDIVRQSDLIRGQGCNVCCIPSKKVLKGYNDLWTTHPKVAKMLKNKEKGYELSKGTHKKEIFICDNCGFEDTKNVSNVVKQGFSCLKCGDGVSYPEKFMSNILDQLGIYHKKDIIFPWSQGNSHTNDQGCKRYDFYIPSLNCIIETHGLQHYENSKRGRGHKKEVENDDYKKKLALQNGINTYISLDCRFSEPEYIKKSLIESGFSELVEISDVDWIVADEFACGTLVKQACDLWNNGIRSTLDISKILGKSRTTVTSYLKKGSSIGLCKYDRLSYTSHVEKGKKICQLNEDGDIIKEWASMKAASEELGIEYTSVVKACKGVYKMAGGFKWIYSQECFQDGAKSQTYRKSVVMLDLHDNYIDKFVSASEAYRKTGVGNKSISGVCRGLGRTAGGYKWMYKEDYEKYISQAI